MASSCAHLIGAACKRWLRSWAIVGTLPVGNHPVAVHAPLQAGLESSGARASCQSNIPPVLLGSSTPAVSWTGSLRALSSGSLWSRQAHAGPKTGAGDGKSEGYGGEQEVLRKKVRKAYEEDVTDAYGNRCATSSANEGTVGERSREAVHPTMNVVDHPHDEPPMSRRVTTTLVEETEVVEPTGEHHYGAKYATRSAEEGFGTRLGQDDEQNENDPSLHEVDAEHPLPAAQGGTNYGDDYQTRSSEEGFGTRMGQDDQPDDPKLHETTN